MSPATTARIRIYLPPCLCALTTGLVSLCYSGPGRELVRGYLGDILIVIFLYYLLSIAWQSTAWRRGISVLLLACLLEFNQLLTWSAALPSPVRTLILGSHFDPADILAYFLGTAIAVGLDRRCLLPRLLHLSTGGRHSGVEN